MTRVFNFWWLIVFLLLARDVAFAQCIVHANFIYSPACQGQQIHFSNLSTVGSGNSISGYLWNFGDGTTSILTNPNHIYPATGTYYVTLTASTTLGCSDVISKQVIVHPNPTASFTYNPSPVTCNDEYINFTNTSTGANLSYLWTFGNGTNSTAQNPQHPLITLPNSCSGVNYNAMLLVTDTLGCTASSSQNITIQPRPTADIVSASDHICAIFVNGHYEAEHTLFNMGSAACLQSYLINWGDGSPLEAGSIDSIDYTHIYSIPGFISVTVYGVGFGGACTTVVFENTVLIEITPTAGIIGPSASWTNGCTPFSTFFILNSNITTTTTQTVIWGGMDTVVLPPSFIKGDTVWHTFLKSGCDSLGVMTPYNVVLEDQNQCGSSITSWGNFDVYRPPIAGFTIPDTICKNDFVTFQNTTKRNLCGGWTLTRFNWKISKNGNILVNTNSLVSDLTAALPNFNFAFSDTGTYEITLTSTDNGNYGCGSTQFSKIVYVQGTYANFWSDTICLGNPTFFYDSSYSVHGIITSWHWKFDDGAQSIDTNAVHTFATAGFHNATLIVFDSNNCSDTITKQAYVSPYPVAGFTNDTVCVGNPTSFNDLSFTTAIDSIVYWKWNFGDGDSSFIQNPAHIFADTGYFNTTLIVSTTFSCPDTITNVVYVSPFPVADFISDTVCLGSTTSFLDLSLTAAIDSVNYWLWDFGDGVQSNVTNPIHTFGISGFHNVTLIVNTGIGCSDTIQKPVYVSPMPKAYFIFDTVCLGYPVHFNDSSYTTAIDTIAGWNWHFGDGDSSFVQNPNHSYHYEGFFSVTLVVTTTFGCTDSITKSVYVNPYPIVNFYSSQVCLGGTTVFLDSTTTSPIDHIISWDWDFGDGGTSILQNPTHVFSTSGYHSVTLHTLSVIGCERSATHNAYVSPFPVANFSVLPTCLGHASVFNNLSTTSGIHPINHWHWTFGDGIIDTTQSPTHIYSDTGVYNVSLYVTTSLGCVSNTILNTTYVSSYPVANFTANNVCLTHITSFNDLSYTLANDNIISWQWSFGYGTFSNIQNPQHGYLDSGFYNVELIVTSSIGCSDTIIKTVYVKPPPIPNFNATTACFSNNTVFTDLSASSAVDVINSWTWSFGDGNISLLQNPNHLYTDTGIFNVSLVVATNLGCSDSITKNVYVSPTPLAIFTVDSVCIGMSSNFNELSYTLAQDSIISWSWDFGDGNLSNVQNPFYIYSDTGHFIVNLIVTTSMGCTDTTQKNTYISPYPHAGFVADTACFGNPTLFLNTSTTDAIDSIVLWSWNFGDGNISALQSPSHLYADTGFYNVVLIVKSQLGCPDTIEEIVYVKPIPNPNFSALPSCLGNAMHFTDLSYSSAVDTINNWFWKFGDGNNSNLQNPSHVYNNPGYFNVTLIVSSSIGCSDSISILVYVSPIPVSNFITDTVCLGFVTSFTNLSYTLANDNITNWNWDFGDGTSSTVQSPTHLFADTGFISVSLIVTTSMGCSDTVTRNIYVSPYPVAAFKADTACLGFPTSFTDLSHTPAIDNIIAWHWNFGDGATSNIQNPQHTYADSGHYNVSLVVSSSFGCADTIISAVYVNAPPVSDFSATTVCLGNTTLFTDISTASVFDNIIAWQWHFGDGISSNQQNPSHLYADTGYFSVSLTVFSLLGCSDTTIKNVYVSPYPVAAFNSDTVCRGHITSFTDLSYTLANDNITGWNWNFGDGTSSTLQNPSHLYADTGFTSVSLIISTSIGCTDTITQNIYVSPYPTAAFKADTACLGFPTSFTDLSYTPAIDNIIVWQWNFGDGATSNIQNPQHTYADSGHYNVSLVVSSSFGCADTIINAVYVNAPPVSDFSATTVCLGNSTLFTDISTASVFDNIIAWQWHFGDGASSNQQNPSHLYADTGYFSVSLTVFSLLGCSDTTVMNVYVSPYPVAAFNSDTVCRGHITSFTDLSYTLANDNITGWNWNFGDGTSSTLQNPSHLYADTGFTSVSLIISTSIGCTDTITQNIYVSPYPTAAFKADTACLGFPTSFTDLSYTPAIDNIIAWQWNFGDGATSNIQNPQHTYADSGHYNVSLIVSSSFGCADTIIRVVYVNAPPVSNFSVTIVCLGNTTLFTDFSTTSVFDNIVAWQWHFGDGASSNQQNPSHLYADTGYFSVSLTVFSLLGCSDTTIMNVYVSPYPVAAFNSDTVCWGHTTSFTDMSYTLANDNITGWKWYFGDGTASTLQNPSHLYADTGFTSVSLIISTSIGCTDTITQNIYVSPYPTASFKADTACLGFPTSFTDMSFTLAIDSIVSWIWFGDNLSTNVQNPQHVFSDSGHYDVSLIVVSTFGCSDTTTETVYVNAPPVSDFSAPTVCLGNATIFTDLSTASVFDNIIAWQWHFGDGTSSNQQNPSHLYADTGYFSVSLTAFSLLGCSDTTVMNVYVSHYPVAAFNSDSVCWGHTTSFTDLSYTLANDSIISWNWSFGDGTSSTLQNPLHLYADTGFTSVSLIVSTSIGCSDTLTQNAYVSPYPVALFKADTACLTWATSFTDLSHTPAIDSIVAWQWDFGDGGTSNLQNPSHTYPDSGYYLVTLISSTTFGCSDTAIQNIFVKPLPSPDFSASTVCLGNSTIYTDLSTSSAIDTINSWKWIFGDGNISNLQNPVHNFADSGTYTTTLVVSSSIGCSDSISKDIYVSPLPVAVFTIDTVCLGNLTNFIDGSYTLANDSIVLWHWDFGDNSSSSLQNPVHIYSDTGFFNVVLIVNTTIGCTDTVSVNAYVSPSPIADFNADSACFSFATAFTDLSHTYAIDSIVVWNWNFGDGNISSLQNPVHLYADTGNYSVTLKCISQIGCSDSVIKNVYVKPLPKPDFSALPVCLGEQTLFNDLSLTSPNDYINGWLWHFENTSSTLQNPSYIFSDTGYFNVKLIAYSSLGCSDSITKSVYVSPYPVSDFKADTVCLGYPTTFNDISYLLNNDSITSWAWNFDDGNTSSLQNPQHIYSDSGYYHVSLIVTSSMGCSDSINRNVYVSPSPVADFSANNVCFGNTTFFNDLSYTYAIDTIQSWAWDFGDGNVSSLQNPQNTYVDTGLYTVTLTIKSTIGCPFTISKNVYVSSFPVAGFVADTVCFGLNTSFTDLSNTLSADSINNWVWQFGDGNSSLTSNATHIYSDTGHYNVQLVVTSSIGCSDSITHIIYVSPYPYADFSADTACLGTATTFSNLSHTDAVDNIVSWDWNFGDGASSNLQNPVHIYSTSGNFNVNLIVHSGIGCNDTVTKNIYVSPLPVAQFTADTVCIGTVTTFSDLSATTAIDSIISWGWDFGDGNLSSIQNPTNLYADSGLYSISLVVSSSLGCKDSIVHNTYVSPMPHADFTADTACLGLPTLFNDLSFTPALDNINNWLWQFGDGNVSNSQNPAYFYSDTGHFNVAVTVSSSFGCKDSVTKVIYVSPYPNADFIADTVCLSLPTTFTNLSGTSAIDSITSWAWNFGDGNTSTQQNPIHAYNSSGSFNVSLIVYSSVACTDTIIKVVYVSPPPLAQFIADTVCLGGITSFTDLSGTLAVDSIIAWSWYFGDGNTSNIQNPYHQYADSGYFTVSLRIVTTLGCSDSVAQNVYVKPLPVANFGTLPTCFGYPTVFTDLSSTATNDSLFSWSWNFGDSALSILQNPTHLYADTGMYSVTLIVNSYMGCSDTIVQNTHVIPLPVAEFDAHSVCFGYDVIFNDLSDVLGYTITNWHWNFGDGNSSVLQNPTHNYSQPGNYTITLTIYNEFNCIDSISHTVNVYDLPVPDFTYNDVCLNLNTIFNDNSSVVSNPIVLWQWYFDDGGTSVLQNPVHLYSNFGTYNVHLTTTDSAGCTDSIFKQVIVYPLPHAGFIADSICSGDTAHFTDTSSTFSGNVNSWQWDFGDLLGTSIIQNPSYLYSSVSVMTDFNVSLIVSNSYGCYDTLNQPLHVNPLPVAQFGADTACFGNATHFSDSSFSNGGAINSWSWAFGDAIGYDSVNNPAYLYNNTGLFSTTLTVYDVKGCTQTVSQTILVDSLPMPSFEWCQVCRIDQQLPVTFVNTSQGNGSTIVNNYWTFGDGQTSTLNDTVTENYTAAGNYNVTLISTNNRGCSDSITQAITLHSGLSIDFTFNNNCFDVSVDATSINATSLIEWEWDFGDGGISNQPDSAQHTYFQPGTYLITLTVFDSLACMHIVCEQSVSHYIYIYPPPIPNFSATNVMVGTPTVFTDLSTAPLSSIASWDWDFGDGTSSTLQNPVHTYGQYGVYFVTLTIQNSYGCSESITQSVIVYAAIIANFDSATVCAQYPLTFNNTSQILLPGVAITWHWDFGDGNSSTDSLPTHIYNLPGIYNVTLIASMASGVADTVVHQITVIENPIADFTFTEVCWGDTLTSFHDNTYSTVPLVLWQWNLGDGTLSNQPNVNHYYAQSGTYNVLLVVQNSLGCTDSINKNIRVFDIPVVNFNVSQNQGCTPMTVDFIDSSTVNEASITNWLWDFGDGLGSVGDPLIGHTYNYDGLYTITLTVMSDQGCQNSLTIPDFIQVHPKPTADFSFSPTVPFNTDLVQFVNLSTGSNSWEWFFGDGNNSNLFDPYHIYDDGFYTITLISLNQYNCADTAFRTIIVKPTSIIYAPNAFSPLNSDGLNDYFKVSGVNLLHFEMRIFNRYGYAIFYSDDINKGWDGRYQGKIVPLGVYVWKVWYKDVDGYSQEVYGTVTVVY